MSRIYKIISTIILLVIVSISIFITSYVLEQKTSRHFYSSYFSENQPFDILIFGSSHVRNGIFPMEFWGSNGYTAYNLAGNGALIPVTYWTMVNALDYHTPQLVILDVFNADTTRKFSESWGQMHYQFDSYPLSYHKYQMVNDLVDDPSMTDGNGVNVYDKRWELLFNLGEYHTRWTELRYEDFDSPRKIINDSRTWKGAEPLIGIATREPIPNDNPETAKYDYTALDYLNRMISLCKDRNIKLLLINTGYDCNLDAKLFHDSVYTIAQNNDINYIDFTALDVIDYNTDLYNSGINTHLNYSGALKITKYISNYVSNNYDFTTHLNDAQCALWQDDYSRYIESKHNYLTRQTELENYLMFLNDPDYDVTIDIFDSSILSNSLVQDLINNIDCNLINEGNNISNSNGTDDSITVVDCTDDNNPTMRITVFSHYSNGIIDSRLF